jgi:hypothetical protein
MDRRLAKASPEPHAIALRRGPLDRSVANAAERQASAGARDGVKGKRNDLAARAPLYALVRWPAETRVHRERVYQT